MSAKVGENRSCQHRIATRVENRRRRRHKERRRRVTVIKTLSLTWRTPAPDDFQKRLLVILGQVRFRALQPHSQRGQFRLEDAENVLHVRSGEIVRVDRDVFAAVADRDLDHQRSHDERCFRRRRRNQSLSRRESGVVVVCVVQQQNGKPLRVRQKFRVLNPSF